MTQIKADLMKKNIATNCLQVTVPVLAGWAKKPIGHYAILNLFPLRSPNKVGGYLAASCSDICKASVCKILMVTDV